MVNPRLLCRQHLLGEHSELHKFLPAWRRKTGIAKRVAGNAIEPRSYQARHDLLVGEMLRRGYRHATPCEQPDFSYLPEAQKNATVDLEASLAELTRRCSECRNRTEER